MERRRASAHVPLSTEYGLSGEEKRYVANESIRLKKRTKWEIIAWLSVGAVLMWYGDGKRWFLDAVLRDPRVYKRPLFVGTICCITNFFIFLYLCVWVRHVQRSLEDFEIVAPGAVPTATILGFLAFILFSVALWPVWNVFIVPILYVFFMDLLMISPILPPYVDKRKD